jgi:lipopolysaccharide transport system permease protein
MAMGRIASNRHLITSLTRRQYHIRYRQSFGGLLWAIVPPLATLGVGSLVFDNVAPLEAQGVPYVLVAMAAIVPWTFFASSLTFGIPSIVGNYQLVTRLAFPRAALPLSMVGVSLLDLAISLLIFVIVAAVLGHGLPATAVWLPLILLIEVVLVSGLVLLGSALNVFARDVRLAAPLLVQFWLFVTPVMYTLSDVPETLRPWYLANPMTGIVEAARQTLVFGQAPEPTVILPAVLGALACFVIGLWYFVGTEPRFADVI